MDKWRTKDEFLRFPVDGWCWIAYDGDVLMSYFENNNFSDEESRHYLCDEDQELITYVMPIYEPKYPGN